MPRKGKRRREAQRVRRQRLAELELERAPEEGPSAAAEPGRAAAPGRRKEPGGRRRQGRGLRLSPWLVALPLLGAGAAVAIVAVVLSGGGGSSGTSAGTPTPVVDPRVAGLTPTALLAIEAGGAADNAFFNPDTITAKAGDVIEITVTNNGTVIHNLRVSGPNKVFDVDTTGSKGDDFEMPPNTIEPGKTGRLVVKMDEPGSYPFRCDFHPLIQKGTLVLE